jgi:hypothetical protein
MFCGNCGTEIPDEANFCWKCGKPQKPGVQVDESRWEMCEIEREYIGSIGRFLALQDQFKFIAKAIGPQGVYNAGETPLFLDRPANVKDREEQQKLLPILIAYLVKNGWEPVETSGRGWYSYKFRRRVK